MGKKEQPWAYAGTSQLAGVGWDCLSYEVCTAQTKTTIKQRAGPEQPLVHHLAGDLAE